MEVREMRDSHLSREPRELHFHEFRGPDDSNLGQRGGKRPGAGRPRLYREGEKPKYKYRYRYINVTDEIFAKFQRLKFEAGFKAEKNFMNVLLKLFEKHSRSIECVNVGVSENSQRWEKLCDQLCLSSEQVAKFLLDLAEQHLYKGGCPGGTNFPVITANKTGGNASQVIMQEKPNDKRSECNLVPEKTENGDNCISSQQSIACLPALQLVPVQTLGIQSAMSSNQATTLDGQNSSTTNPDRGICDQLVPPALSGETSESLMHNSNGLCVEDDNIDAITLGGTSSGVPNKSPQPYVTFKWWNVFPSERSKKKSRANALPNVQVSDLSKVSEIGLNCVKSKTDKYTFSNININKSVEHVAPPVASLRTSTTWYSCQPTFVETKRTDTNAEASPVSEDMPLNLSLREVSCKVSEEFLVEVTNIKVEPGTDGVLNKQCIDQKSTELPVPIMSSRPCAIDTGNGTQPKLSKNNQDPNVRKKVKNLMSTIDKIGGRRSPTISDSVTNAESHTLGSNKIDGKKVHISPCSSNSVDIQKKTGIKRSYATRSSTCSVTEAQETTKPDIDGKYYIMNLCKKKKINDPEFGRWSFTRSRSSSRNSKKQWKINRIENYICKSCGKTFMSEKWFVKHVEAEHCGKIIKDRNITDEEHIEGLGSSNICFTCEKCNKVFVTETLYFLHKSSGPCHRKDDYMTQGFHLCNVDGCNRIFSSEHNLWEHTRHSHQ